MRSKFYTTVAVLLLMAAGCSGAEAEDATHLLDRPLELFEKALIPVLNGGERGVLKTTLRGFQIRVDRQSEIENELSEIGIFLDVEVRDAKEIPESQFSVQLKNKLKIQTVKVAAISKESTALAIYVTSGSQADAKALKAIEDCFSEILKKAKQAKKKSQQ